MASQGAGSVHSPIVISDDEDEAYVEQVLSRERYSIYDGYCIRCLQDPHYSDQSSELISSNPLVNGHTEYAIVPVIPMHVDNGMSQARFHSTCNLGRTVFMLFVAEARVFISALGGDDSSV